MTIRWRVTILSITALALAVGIFAAVAITRTRTVLEARTTEELKIIARGMVGPARQQIARHDDGRRLQQWRSFQSDTQSDLNHSFSAVMLSDGTVLSLPALSPNSVAVPQIPDDLAKRVGSGTFTAVAANGTEFAAIASAIPNSDAVIFTALEDRRTESAIEELITTYRLTGAALIVAFAGLSIAVVGLGLRPLRRLTAAASSITSNGTGSRMPPGRPGTEVGDLSDALNQMIDELHGMARSTRTFAADAAHELRTPVTTIIGYAELYHNGMLSDPDRIDSAFTRISHEARRLSALSEGLLLMNQIELRSLHQMTEPPAQPFDLRELCAEAAADAMTVNSAYPIELDGPTGVLIAAHRDRIQQVITNLLNNVRQHTPSGTLTTIEIRVRDTTVEMVVADTGPGMSDEILDRAFERLSQGGQGLGTDSDLELAPSSGRPRGAGLGLAIVRALIEEAGGSVAITSPSSSGVEVTVVIPTTSEPTSRP